HTGETGAADIENNDVRDHLRRIGNDAWNARQAFSQELRTAVIVGQALGCFFESNQGGSGQYARLPHGAAQAFAVEPAPRDRLLPPPKTRRRRAPRDSGSQTPSLTPGPPLSRLPPPPPGGPR